MSLDLPGCPAESALISHECSQASACFAAEVVERTERQLREYFLDNVGSNRELFMESMGEWDEGTDQLQMELLGATSDADILRLGRSIQERMKLASETAAGIYARREAKGTISQAVEDNDRARWEDRYYEETH